MRLIDADTFEKTLESAEIKARQDRKYVFESAINTIRGNLRNAPTVEPESHWIPCSERMPEEIDAGILKKLGTEKRSEYVLTTVEVKGERMTVTACTYDGAWDWNMKYAFPDFKVIAWMPLPEPYKEENK